MTQQPRLHTDAINALEQANFEHLRQLSSQERGEWLMAVCRAAAEIEASRLQMGMSPTQPAPWPESTWKFFAEAARRARDE